MSAGFCVWAARYELHGHGTSAPLTIKALRCMMFIFCVKEAD